MRYRSVVPLRSAPDVDEIPRVRLYKLTPEVASLCNAIGIYDGDSLNIARVRIEAHMKRLNDDQRRKFLLEIGVLIK